MNKLCRPGIYMILNLINGHRYVGSATNLSNRWTRHRIEWKKGKNGRRLQIAWNKYGGSAFVFQVIEYVEDPVDLLAREQCHIDRLIRWGTDYNIARIAGNLLGTKQRPETIAKRRLAMIGNKYSQGVKRSEEYLAKQRAAQHRRYNKQRPSYVDEIRRLYTGKRGEQAMLSAKFGVSRNQVSRIVRGVRWTL